MQLARKTILSLFLALGFAFVSPVLAREAWEGPRGADSPRDRVEIQAGKKSLSGQNFRSEDDSNRSRGRGSDDILFKNPAAFNGNNALNSGLSGQNAQLEKENAEVENVSDDQNLEEENKLELENELKVENADLENDFRLKNEEGGFFENLGVSFVSFFQNLFK